VSYLPGGLYQIDLLVIPKWGLYANMIAQLICQISSHYIIHYHRRIIEDASNRHLRAQRTESEDDDDDCAKDLVSQARGLPGNPEKLCYHAFRRAHRGESDKLVARRVVSPMLLVTALFSAAMIVIGCIVPTFSIDILGIVGVMVESGQAFVDAKISYSVISMIQALFEQASLTGSFKDYLGLGSLSFLVVLSVLVVPIVQLLALLIQWLAPLTQFQRHRLSVSLEILQAWQYIEVYLLAVLVGSWQLGAISGRCFFHLSFSFTKAYDAHTLF
jgi:Paraquat-inducible protein A